MIKDINIIDGINIEPLLKAFRKFDQFRMNVTTDQNKAGAIQAYEYCFELSWKTMKRILATRGLIAHSPRDVFRLAALEGFIQDPLDWFEYLKYRNLTVHTYQETEVEKIIQVLPEFATSVLYFLNVLGVSNVANAGKSS